MTYARVAARVEGYRRAGLTLRAAAAAAGVHVATVCRWQKNDSVLRYRLARAADDARRIRRMVAEALRPDFGWRRDCPACRAKVVVRTAGGARYWRCGRWPLCPWRSWRPRHPRDCRRCGSPRFWSHSRLTVACGGCGVRTTAPLRRTGWR